MSLRRIGVLLGKELWRGPKSFLFVWAVIGPVAISLVVSLIFGTLFAELPRLGVVDEGSSALVMKARATAAIATREFRNIADLRQAVESGKVDMGIVIPSGFDASVREGNETTFTVFIWGESPARDRTILGSWV